MDCVFVPDLGHCPVRKPLLFHPAAREEMREQSKSVRWEFSRVFWRLQSGKSVGMPLSRPMPIVAMGVDELRVRDESGQYRAFVVRKMPKGIYVLHIFAKKSQETPDAAIALARKRLKEMLVWHA